MESNKGKNKAFLCYRGNTAFIAKSFLEYVKKINDSNEDNRFFGDFYYSDEKAYGNYLDYEKLKSDINDVEWFIVFLGDKFHEGFLIDNKINPNCVTAHEIKYAVELKKKIIIVNVDGNDFGKNIVPTISKNNNENEIKIAELDKEISTAMQERALEETKYFARLFMDEGRTEKQAVEMAERLIKGNNKNYFDSRQGNTEDFFERILESIGFVVVDKKMYLECFKTDNAYNSLPLEKLQRCVYNKVCDKTMKEVIEEFDKLYISKTVYRLRDNDTSERINNFIDDILNQHSVLVGSPGCGKSTLLFNVYLKYVEKLRLGESKVIPIFLDLKDVLDGNKLITHIESATKLIKGKYDFVNLFKELKEDSYKVLLILDSLDECNSDSIHGQMTRFEKNNSFLNESGIDYKVLVGLRSGLFEQTGIREVTNRLKNYTVKDFDKSNVEEYLEKLVESNIIKKKQLDTIKTSIKLLTIHDRINPFLLAMIIDNYSYLNNDKNVIVDDIKPIKIVDLINDSAERQIIKVNDSRVGVVTYNTNPNPNTLNIVGIRGLMENKETIDKAFEKYNVIDGFLSSRYKDDIATITSRTYLLDKNAKFYQKIFTDFYGARYVFDTLNNTSDSFPSNFLNVMSEVVKSEKLLDFYGYLILLIDKNFTNNKKTLDRLFDFMFKHSNADNKTIYKNISSMLEYMKRYSSPMYNKDSYNIKLEATYNYEKTVEYIYQKYFEYLALNNDINFGAFYGSLVRTRDFCIIMNSIYNLINIVPNERIFEMLSIFRDCYVEFNYDLNNKDYKCEYPSNFDDERKDEIYNLATNGKSLGKMKLREVLNALFYSKLKRKDIEIELKNVKHFIKDICFPKIYEISLFTNLEKESKRNHIVSIKDDLLFDASLKNFSIAVKSTAVFKKAFENRKKRAEQTEIKSKKGKETKFDDKENKNDCLVELDDCAVSLFIYGSDETKVIYDALSNKKNIKSVEMAEGISVIDKFVFSECENLLNVNLPTTLKEIEKFAFEHCDYLPSLVLNEGLEKIGESFVEDCSCLKEIVIPTTVKEMGNYVFEQCSSLERIDFQYNDDLKLPDGLLKGCRSLLNFEDLHISKNTSEFPMIAFSSVEQITEIDLSDYERLKTIHNYCFTSNPKLEKIVFPKSLESIGIACFYDCTNLKEVVFNSKPICSNQLFAGLDENHNIKLIVEGDEYLINGSTNLENLFKQIGIETTNDKFINNIAFEHLGNESYMLGFSFNEDKKEFETFKSSDYGIRIEKVMIGGFGNHLFLKDVIFDENLKETAEWMFEDCPSLNMVDFGKTKIKSLRAHMFKNCETLTEVVLPPTVEAIEENAFDGCNLLRNIYFAKYCADNCKCDIYDLINCNHHNENDSCNIYEHGVIRIPSNIAEIKEYAFKDCPAIKEFYYNKPTIVSPLVGVDTQEE